MNNLDTFNRFRTAYAGRKVKAEEGGGDSENAPVTPNVALLKRVQRIIFSANVTTLSEAKSRLATLIESLSDEDEETKKNEKPSE